MAPKQKGGARGGPKPGTKQAKAAAERSLQNRSTPQNEAEPSKKPSVKDVIGGASWTGKLPVNMLSEHCQKHKWEKPEYTMTKTPEGFISTVILRKVDPKTKERINLPPMQLPSSHKHLAAQPTALEARHFAATYALFRVCNMRNLHTMMPPSYRKLWKEDFSELKNAATRENKGWMYEADPFLAKQERDSAAADFAKKESEYKKAQSRSEEKTIDLGLGASGNTRGGKIWSHAPKVDLGTRMRRDIEELLRQHTIWNPYNVRISEEKRKEIVDEFSQLGFRRSHVEEAVLECKDREEVLEWLLLYVPEDDLPRWSLPEGYTAGISLASGDLIRESKIKRLAAAGYPVDLCSQVLDNHRGDEAFAAEYLQKTLVHGAQQNWPDISINDDDDAWKEEQPTLEAIFGDRYSQLSPTVCEIKGDVTGISEGVIFRFQRPSYHYPSTPPITSVLAKSIPAYIRLSVIRQATQYAEESLVRQPMIFNIIDWLKFNLPEIMENPGKLRDISTVSSSSKGLAIVSQLSTRSTRKPQTLDLQLSSSRGLAVYEAWEKRQATPAQKKMIQKRELLPAWAIQGDIIHAVKSHQVTIISGETGSGKSTQSVQFLLDDMIRRELGGMANLVCTQPRRISALGLADRVSDERCSPVGDEVGYVIRGDSKVKPGTTKITFMTTGVLLRRLQTGQETSDDISSPLADITHVVVDEVHERSLDTDFLLALLRDVLKYRQDLKVILMSATLDADVFTEYFGGHDRVGRVNIPGRTFPVNDYYLDDVVRRTGFSSAIGQLALDEDVEPNSTLKEESLGKALRNLGVGISYDLIASTVRYVDSQLGNEPGGILIFLPGTMEIDRCLAALRTIPYIHPLPLHASLLPVEQKRVFLAPPKGKRKVIAATNVAETSITIEDIVTVIDTGRVKEISYDPKGNVVRLQEVWASQAACEQRRGRAGRVRAGTCYKLYTRTAESNMAIRPDPEIRRVPLEQLCLSVLAMKGTEDAAMFLSKTLTPPEDVAVEGALELLHRIGAMDNQKLTALGRYLLMIPADLRCAKLMVYGSIFGCMDASVTIAAILTVKSPFVSPREKRDEAAAARATFSKGDGDLLTDLSAYQHWVERAKTQGYWQTHSWCSENFLSHQTLRDISSNRAQFLTSLKDVGILPVDYKEPTNSSPSHWDRNGNSTQLLRALIAGAFNPQIAQISFPDKKFAASMTGTVELDPDTRTIKYFNQENGRVFIHPSSSLFTEQNYSGAAFLSYFNKMATSKVFIRELTPFNAYSLLLFAGPISLDTMGRGLIVDGWLRLRGWARIGVLVSRLRLMLDDVLASRIDNPSLGSGSNQGSGDGTGQGAKVVDIVKRLVEVNGLDQ